MIYIADEKIFHLVIIFVDIFILFFFEMEDKNFLPSKNISMKQALQNMPNNFHGYKSANILEIYSYIID